MSAPWTPVRLDEITRLADLTSVEIRVLLATRCLTRNGWTTRRRDIARKAACSPARAKLALARLERDGWFRRAWCGGEEKAPWGRFKVTATGIDPDPSPGGNWDRDRSQYTSQDPDRIQNPPSKTGRNARAVSSGREGGAPPVVPGGGPDALLALCRKLWPTLAVKPARKYLAALRELAEGASEEELARYLRRAAEDRTLETARVPLAVACTPDRVRGWRRRTARRRAAPKREPEALAPREAAALLEAARRRL